MSGNRIQIEHRPVNWKGFKSALAQRDFSQTRNNSRFQTGCNVPERDQRGGLSVPFPWQTLDQLNNLWVNPSRRRPIAVSTRECPFRGVALWWRRQPLHDGFGVAVTAAEHPRLYGRFVVRDAFDHASAESARITSSTDGGDVALLDILRDDRRSDDPRRRRVRKPGGRGTGRRGWASAPIRRLLNREEADLFSEEQIMYRNRG